MIKKVHAPGKKQDASKQKEASHAKKKGTHLFKDEGQKTVKEGQEGLFFLVLCVGYPVFEYPCLPFFVHL